MDLENEFKTIKSIVEKLLMSDEKVRNSDKWLIIEVLRELGFKIYIDYTQLDEMPSFESITRCRRKIQEEKPNLQADEVIQDFREKKRQELRAIFNTDILKVENSIKIMLILIIILKGVFSHGI